jgi:hypothetical protein
MYADDAAIFINPVKEDVQAVKTILEAFGTFSGLHINLQKSSVHPIRCENVALIKSYHPLLVAEAPSHANIWDCNFTLDRFKRFMFSLSLNALDRGYRNGRAIAKQSWVPHFGQFSPLLHANLPPHSVSFGRLSKKEN